MGLIVDRLSSHNLSPSIALNETNFPEKLDTYR